VVQSIMTACKKLTELSLCIALSRESRALQALILHVREHGEVSLHWLERETGALWLMIGDILQKI